MPQLLFPGDPFAIGIETAILGSLFGLSFERSMLMGGLYFAYNTYIQQQKQMMPIKKKTVSQQQREANNYTPSFQNCI